jgi:hypothetical protein
MEAESSPKTYCIHFRTLDDGCSPEKNSTFKRNIILDVTFQNLRRNVLWKALNSDTHGTNEVHTV